MYHKDIVNVVWLCKILTKKFHKKYFVKVYKNAVCSCSNGWLCDCGHWTSGDDSYHVPIHRGEREVYENEYIR
jgi:hypothetical protein